LKQVNVCRINRCRFRARGQDKGNQRGEYPHESILEGVAQAFKFNSDRRVQSSQTMFHRVPDERIIHGLLLVPIDVSRSAARRF
jgi:hypothetical protein